MEIKGINTGSSSGTGSFSKQSGSLKNIGGNSFNSYNSNFTTESFDLSANSNNNSGPTYSMNNNSEIKKFNVLENNLGNVNSFNSSDDETIIEFDDEIIDI